MKTYTLITGASTGFGRALTLECAQRSMNMVLVALPNSGLPNLCAFLRTHYKIDVLCFEIDLSTEDNCLELYRRIKNSGCTIKYLINNAGVLSSGLFEDLSKDYFLKQIEVNITAPTLLTKLFLDDLKVVAPSGILNVCSMASFFYLPKKQVYGGTKAYLLSFSKSLRKELKRHGISVSIVCPGGMNTTSKICLQNRKLGSIARQSILDPEDAARITMQHFLKSKEVIIPGQLNKVFKTLDALLPEFIKNKLTSNAI